MAQGSGTLEARGARCEQGDAGGEIVRGEAPSGLATALRRLSALPLGGGGASQVGGRGARSDAAARGLTSLAISQAELEGGDELLVEDVVLGRVKGER